MSLDEQRGAALSVIVLSYNVREYLALALRTAEAACQGIRAEIIVVDNDSSDGSAEMVERDFPDVRLIRSGANLGFAGGNNVGIDAAMGRYVLLLNPDVLVHPTAFSVLVDCLDENPGVGAVGGRIVNPDGTIDPGARRGFPSPSAAFYRMVGLSYLFPRSPRFGRYAMSYHDDDARASVDALSGCFMCVRREVIEQVGALDDEFFMYGEDLDWSYRIREAGWEIVYQPESEIVHFKGESTRSMPRLKQLFEFHRAMHLFVRKHFAKKLGPIALGLIETGILLRGLGVTVWRLALAGARPILDVAVLVASVAVALATRALSGWLVPPFGSREWMLIGTVFLVSGMIGALAVGLYRGSAEKTPNSGAAKAALAAVIGGGVCIVAIFFIKTINFSRIVVGLSWLYAGAGAAVWRWLLSRKSPAPSGRGLVIGCGPRAEAFLSRVDELVPGYLVMGAVRTPDSPTDVASVANFPIVGDLDDLPFLARRLKIDDVIVAWEQFQYKDVLFLARKGSGYPRRVRLVPEAIDAPAGDGVDSAEPPLIDLELPRRSLI